MFLLCNAVAAAPLWLRTRLRYAPPVEPSSFRLEIVASEGEIDELGHVSNIAYVRWVQEVARAHSHAAGWDAPKYQQLGAVWVTRRHEVDYLSPAYLADRIALRTWIESWRGASAVRRTEITRTTDERLLARATTLWVLVDVKDGRPRRVPAEMIAAFSPAPPA
jgi:acyl-CoA thioester hydrolase